MTPAERLRLSQACRDRLECLRLEMEWLVEDLAEKWPMWADVVAEITGRPKP